jgi:hypothetical protein
MLLAFCLLPLSAATATGRPAHKQALAQYFGPLLPKALHDCRTCHLPTERGQADDDRPHNAFGQRLKAVRDELRRAGKPTTIDARLDAILEDDADGDGASNLVEILTGHQPGDRADHPSSAELEAARPLLAEFARLRQSYPWRPLAPVARPAIPVVKAAAWVRNPIDAFIAAEQETHGLRPRPEAPKEVLLRRLHLDLLGLPPTPTELHAFVNDTAADAYEKLVERLLASPLYGERWGRHWMDVWRYSDWAGYGPQVRDSQPHIWRWRDWIIDSLNADKGYDRMVLEMLAGDELAPQDPQALAATGYLVRNFKLLSREKWLQDTVGHTFMAFQGVTLQCARCHDHMYDPLLQREYYQVRAIFEPHHVRIDRVPGEPDIKKDGLPRVYDKDLAASTYLYVRGDDRTPDKSKALEPGVPEALGGSYHVEAVKLPPQPPPPPPEAKAKEKPLPYPETSSGRRLALARWIAQRDNPLTARVAVNHIWLRHFGQALVPTVFDFGRNGRPPSHPALLDWLAAEFMDRGWSMKALHRLIVTSSTYRLASTPEEAAAKIDPDNKYLWRYPPHRLEAEAVRDSLFHVAGHLDLRRGGPDIDYPLGLSVPRRSLYFRHAAEKQMEFLLLFDAASVTECYERRHSIVPQQALALLNSEVSLKQARLLAGSIGVADDRTFTMAAFKHVLSRPPTAAELAECTAFLQARTSLAAPESSQRTRASLVHALMNHHDFVTIR